MNDTTKLENILHDTTYIKYDTTWLDTVISGRNLRYPKITITETNILAEQSSNLPYIIFIIILSISLIALLLYFLIPRKKQITIFLYGHSGAGKTSLIQSMIGMVHKDLSVTDDFYIYKTVRPISKNSKQNLHIRIADYRGQRPAQLISHVQNMKINSMLFIVDIAPAYSSENTKYTDDEVFELMKNDYQNTIQNRLKDHEDYLTKYLIQLVFDYALNPNLKNVYLIINKVDIVTELQKQNIFPKDKNVSEYIKTFFFKIEDAINSFCASNDIADFKIYLVSSKYDTNVNKMFSDLIKTHI